MTSGDQTVAFANRGKVYIAGANGTPAQWAFAAVKDVEITVSADHVPLYAWGSIFRIAVAKHQQKIAVKVGSMKFNPAVTGSSPAWWGFITAPSAGATGSASGEDTNSVKLFNIDAVFTFEDGQVLRGKVYNVYFPNLPIRASEGQWMKLDISGEGATVEWAAA